jgi:hypothetical protein
VSGLATSEFNDVTGETVNEVSISTSAGWTLIAAVSAYTSADVTNHIVSMSDSAGNTWDYSTALNNQNPPVSGGMDGSGSFYGLAAIAVCTDAEAVSSVSVTLAEAPFDYRLTIIAFGDMPPGAAIDAATALAAGVTEADYTTVAATASAADDIAVAVATPADGWTSADSPFVYQGTDLVSGWAQNLPAGSRACTFLSSTSQGIAGSAMLLITGTHSANGAVSRLWPSGGGGTLAPDTGAYTLASEFSLSANAFLTGIWFYSASGATALPTYAAGIWAVATQALVPGTLRGVGEGTVTGWSGAAGSGWVKLPFYGGVELLEGHSYYVAVAGNPGVDWYSATSEYWGTGAGSAGIASGILTAPDNASSAAGQSGAYSDNWAYPFESISASNFWVDVEVTQKSVSPGSGLLPGAFP